MKRSYCFFLILNLLTSIAFSQLSNFKYKREISGIDSLWHSIELPYPLFSKVAKDFSDLRIIGITQSNDTVEAPYILKVSEDKIEQKEIAFDVINQSTNQDGSYFTFQINGGNTINQILLEFGKENFDWKLRLEGSQDQKQWFSILDDYRILSIKNEATNYQFTELNFPNSQYKYFRLLIKNEKTTEFKNAKIKLNSAVLGDKKKYTFSNFKSENDRNKKQTVINVSLKDAIPINTIQFYVQDKLDFYRYTTIEYLIDSVKTDKGWIYNYASLSSGIVSSFEQNIFTSNATIAKEIKITIENQDNTPLKIDSIVIASSKYSLLTRFVDKGNYALYYGNSSINSPDYDIAHFVGKLPTSATIANLSEETVLIKTEEHSTEPLFQNKIWLWIIMAIIIALLGWFSLKMIGSKQD